YVGFCVQDEGSGIKEDDLPYLFERFYRGDKSRARKTGGIGIGLSIVKALMDAHRGKIQIDSTWKEGTEITVIFPKHETLRIDKNLNGWVTSLLTRRKKYEEIFRY